MLHKIDDKNWSASMYCVPSCISMITGANVGVMHSRAAFLLDQKITDVKGITDGEAIILLREQGYKAIPIDLVSRYDGKPPTVSRFLKERTNYEKVMPVYFTTKDHAMCAQYGFAGDNRTKKPIPVEQFPHLSKKVCSAYIISK
jgi:hypothetical protein